MLNYTTTENSTNRAQGSSGKIYLMNFSNGEKTSGTVQKGNWAQVTAKGRQSAFSTLTVGKIFRANSAVTLASGDKVREFTPVASGIAQGITGEITKESFDVSTQTDKTKTYVYSDMEEASGSMDLVLQTSDPLYIDINKQFSETVEIAVNGSMTEHGKQDQVFHLLLSQDEVGNPELWRYIPMKFGKMPFNKPLKGEVILSLEYTLHGSSGPHSILIYR